MANGKNVSMFGPYPQSAAWELAITFSKLLFLRPFSRPDGTNKQAARAQAEAMVKVLRLLGESEDAGRSQDLERKRAWRKPPIDWMKEADRLEDIARKEEWYGLIRWAQETRGKLSRHDMSQ